MKNSLVSVIIPCYNEEETIGECIKSFLKQTYKPIEIIVVDDGSTDNSRQIASRYPVRIIMLEVNRGRAYARNAGIKLARGDIVIIADADGKNAPNYIETLIKPLKNPKVGGVLGGLRKIWSNKKNVITKFWKIYWQAVYQLMIEKKRPIMGAWAFRKGVFDEVGLYDEKLAVGEDRDLANRVKKAGYKIVWVPNTYVYHKDPDTLKKFVRRIWWGSILCKEFEMRWGIWPKGFSKFILIGRNLAATLLPFFLLLSFLNFWWLVLFLGIFLAESLFPLFYLKDYRRTFKLALKLGEYKLFFATPFIVWILARITGYGRLYAMLRK